jgi:hypothetical protein
MAYIRHYYERDNTIEHTRMQQRAGSHQIVDNHLYKTSILGPSFGASVRLKVRRYYQRFMPESAEAT